MKQVYLAGPITGLSYAGATDWRAKATNELARFGIAGISPMRAKEFLAKERQIGSGSEHADLDSLGLSLPHGFVTRDRFDVQHCDVVLMNLLGAERVSIGTMVEIGWADAWRKPVVLVMDNPRPVQSLDEGGHFIEEWHENVHEHGFVRELTHYQVETLEEGISVCAAILA